MKKLLLVVLLGLLLISPAFAGESIPNCGTSMTLELKQLSIVGEKSLSGSFFLGCGSFDADGEVYYYFYTKNKNSGAISLQKVPYTQVYLYETKETPKAVITCATYNSYNRGSFITFNGETCFCYSMKWKLYIPEGSICYNFNPNVTENRRGD